MNTFNIGTRIKALLFACVMLLGALIPSAAICEGGRSGVSAGQPVTSGLDPASSLADAKQESCGDDRTIYHMNHDDKMDFSTIRVLISFSRQNKVRLKQVQLKLHGEYYFTTNNFCILDTTDNRQTMTVKVENGVINAYDAAGALMTSGTKLQLNRVYVSHTAGYATLYTTSGSDTTTTYCTNGYNYLGNLTFFIDDGGYLRMINSVPLAHYAYGVVGYEMSPSKAAEALRAQAIAAKCYGMCFMSGEDDYDVQDGYDNATYQKYRGYSTASDKLPTLDICLSVIGKALSFEGEVIPTFYGASNGGETTLPSIAFTHSRYDAAYEITLDPVDWAVSPRHEELTVVFGEQTEPESHVQKFMDFILLKANAELGGNYNSVVSIDDLYCYQPMQTAQHDMRMIHTLAVIADAEGNEIEYSLDFESVELKQTDLVDCDGSGNDYSVNKHVFDQPYYYAFWGEPFGGGYTVHICRNGNGIGLSQHGAAAMATAAYGSKDHRQILAFYYPHFDYISITESDPEAPLLTTLTVKAYGRCTGGYVNLRTEPRIAADTFIEVVTQNEHLDIISVTEDGAFYQVLCRGHMGYISTNYSSIDLFPAPADATFVVYKATARENVILRTAPTVNASSVTVLNGNELTLWTSIGSWYYATADGFAGFIRSNDVTVTGEFIYDGAETLVNKAPQPRFKTKLTLDAEPPVIYEERRGR